MNRKLTLVFLSLITGLLGGFASRYISPELAHAQMQIPPPREVRAQRFVLVDQSGNPAGLFGFDPDGNPDIVLLDKAGKVTWSAAGKPIPKPHDITVAK